MILVFRLLVTVTVGRAIIALSLQTGNHAVQTALPKGVEQPRSAKQLDQCWADGIIAFDKELA